MSMPITAIWVLAVLGMGVLLVMQPRHSIARWRGRSTAGPSHYRNSSPGSTSLRVRSRARSGRFRASDIVGNSLKHVVEAGIASGDVILAVLARQRQPAMPPSITTPDALRLKIEPVADCDRYDSIRKVA